MGGLGISGHKFGVVLEFTPKLLGKGNREKGDKSKFFNERNEDGVDGCGFHLHLSLEEGNDYDKEKEEGYYSALSEVYVS